MEMTAVNNLIDTISMILGDELTWTQTTSPIDVSHVTYETVNVMIAEYSDQSKTLLDGQVVDYPTNENLTEAVKLLNDFLDVNDQIVETKWLSNSTMGTFGAMVIVLNDTKYILAITPV